MFLKWQAAIGCLASTLDSSVRKKILISLLNKFDPAGENETEGQVNQSNDSMDEEKEKCSATKTQLKRYSSSRMLCPVIFTFTMELILVKSLA